MHLNNHQIIINLLILCSEIIAMPNLNLGFGGSADVPRVNVADLVPSHPSDEPNPDNITPTPTTLTDVNKPFIFPELKGNLLGNLADPDGGDGEGEHASGSGHQQILSDLSALNNVLTKLTSAATLATNSSSQLAGIISTVTEGAQRISNQVEILHGLAQELSKEVSKPLEAVQPLVQIQIELMTTLNGSIEGVVGHVHRTNNNLLSLQFLIFICLGIGGFTSFLCFIIIIILCCNRRATAKSKRNRARIESGHVGRPISRHDASLMKDFETENRTDTLTLKTRF